MNLRKQFKVKNDVDNKRFVFDSVDNNSCSYKVSYFECDSDEDKAWVCVWKSKKAELVKIRKVK